MIVIGIGWQGIKEVALSKDGVPLICKIFLTGILVSVFEEGFFRGYFYQLCKRQISGSWAILLNMILFSLIHYIKPSQIEDLRIVHWNSGFHMIGMALQRFSDPIQIVSGLLVLMCVAWILCWTIDCTSNLYLAIGLHAGWIVMLQWSFEWTRGIEGKPGWLVGGGDLSQGILAIVPLILQFLALRWWIESKWRKKGG